jgi:Carbohydrate esterase, sialic acid-specific acetylesterase/Immunoglobulin I-set domain
MAIRPFTGSNQQTRDAQAYSPTPGFKIVLAVGQSNAQGQLNTADSAIDVVDPSIYQWVCLATDAHYQQIIQGQDPLKWVDLTGVAGTTSPATWFARAYSKAISSPVLIVPAAQGGTSMHGGRWRPSMTPGGGGDLFENSITQANACIVAAKAMYPGSTFEGVYWCQGEADGDAGVTQEIYSSDLTLLINAYRSRITGAANSWFLCLSMPYETMQYYPGCVPIHYAQIKTIAATPRAKFVHSTRGRTIAPGSNRHRTAKGVREMGLAMASVVFSAAAKTSLESLPEPVQVSGVAISSVSGSGATVAWDACAGADTYKVEYSINDGETWVTSSRQWGDATTLALTSLNSGTTHKVRVSGCWQGSYGQPSSSSTFSTLVEGLTAPTFSVQPSSQAVVEGATATFSSTAVGTPTPTYQWQRSSDSGATWSSISGATLHNYTTPTATVTGGTANSGDRYRVIATNSAGSVTSSSASLVVSAYSEVVYTFDSDSSGAVPANTTVAVGSWAAGASGISGWTTNALHCTSSPADVAGVIKFNNMPAATNQCVTWRRGATELNKARDGVMLRVQSAAAGGTFSASQQGYWFHRQGVSGALTIYVLTGTGPSNLGSFTLADTSDLWLRATVNGSRLLFEYSTNGTAWETALDITDTTFSTAQAVVNYMSGALAPNPSVGWIDNITYRIL